MYPDNEQKVFTVVHDGILSNFVFSSNFLSLIFLEANKTSWIVISILADGNKHTKPVWWSISKYRCLSCFKVNGGSILGDTAGKGSIAKARYFQFIPFSLLLGYIGHFLSHEAICHIRLLAIYELALKSNLINQVLNVRILLKTIESFSTA